MSRFAQNIPKLIINTTPISVPSQLFPPLSGGTLNSDTAAYTPTANSLKCIFTATRHSASTTPPSMNMSDSLGQTWANMFDQTVLTGATFPGLRCQLWFHRTTNSPVSMTSHVAASGGTSHSGVFGFELPDNVADDFSKIFSAPDQNGDPSVTMGSAPDYRSVTIGFAANCGLTAFATTPSGYTVLGAFIGGTGCPISIVYKMGNVATGLAWTSVGQAALGVGFEARQN